MKLARLITFGFLLLSASTGFSQGMGYEDYSFDFVGGGARAEGMGKAYIGVSDDVNAISWNPAGLYIHEKPVLSMSWGSFAPRGEGLSSYDGSPDKLKYTNGGDLSSITALSFLAPIRIKGHQFVGAIGYTRNFDEYQHIGSEFSAEDSVIVFVPFRDTLPVPRTWDVDRVLKGGLYTANFGFGTRLYQDISFGASVNVYAGESVMRNALVRYSDNYPLQVMGAIVYGEELYTETTLDTARFSGVNFTLGFKLNKERVRAGLVLDTPFDLKADRTVDIFIDWRSRRPPGNFVTQYSDIIYLVNEMTKYEIPLRIGIGGAIQVTDRLLVSADLEYQAFGSSKALPRDSIRIDPGGDDEEFFTEIDPRWNDVFAVRVGGEYVLNTSFGLVPLRAGFGYIPMPGPSFEIEDWRIVIYQDRPGSVDTAIELTNFSLSTVNQLRFSLGTGVHWQQIHLDWAYTYATYDRELSQIVSYGFAGWHQYDGTIENRSHHFNMTFTGYF